MCIDYFYVLHLELGIYVWNLELFYATLSAGVRLNYKSAEQFGPRSQKMDTHYMTSSGHQWALVPWFLKKKKKKTRLLNLYLLYLFTVGPAWSRVRSAGILAARSDGRQHTARSRPRSTRLQHGTKILRPGSDRTLGRYQQKQRKPHVARPSNVIIYLFIYLFICLIAIV